jgi:hypothetical protein
MTIDFSPLKEQLNNMAIQLGIILIIPLIAALLVKLLLLTIKLPQRIANLGGSIAFLFVFYQTIIKVLG